MRPIILASQSPRRKQLLEWAEVPFEIIVSDSDETYPEDLTAREIAIHIAIQKAIIIRQKFNPQKPILAADTIVVCEGNILGKPSDEVDAFRMIKMLSGKTHQVITGVCLLHKGETHSFSDETKVTFHSLSDEQIHFYIQKYKPFDKAGAYAIQEWIGVIGIHSIEGDFYNVMGLPVSRVVQVLKNLSEQ